MKAYDQGGIAAVNYIVGGIVMEDCLVWFNVSSSITGPL